jgi:hydroxyethylthiazole kinase-like sugar kinase family protein
MDEQTKPAGASDALGQHNGGLTDEQKQALFAAIERRKQDPDYPAYLERVMEGVREYRRRIQDDLDTTS